MYADSLFIIRLFYSIKIYFFIANCNDMTLSEHQMYT